MMLVVVVVAEQQDGILAEKWDDVVVEQVKKEVDYKRIVVDAVEQVK